MIERKDWKEPWFNRSSWIFAHLEALNLTPNEALVLMVINQLNEMHEPVTFENVPAKCHLDPLAVDDCYTSLSEKGYLSIESTEFCLEGLLDDICALETEKKSGINLSRGLLDEFSAEFGRPLSGSEMEQIAELEQTYTEPVVLRALDEAAAYDKRSLPYICKVLADWSSKGLSPEDIERGLR